MRLIPPVWLVFALVDVYLINRFLPPITVIDQPTTLIGLPIAAIGVCIILWCAFQFMRHKTTIHPGHTPINLITTGIYNISRNPIYLAMAIIIAGFTIYTGNLVTLPIPIIFIGIITVLFIEPEEHTLTSEFAQEYTNYCKATRRWI